MCTGSSREVLKKMNFELQKDDIRYIVGNGLFPDACIVIYCEEKDVIKRNLPGRLTHYKEYNKLGLQLISSSLKALEKLWSFGQLSEFS